MTNLILGDAISEMQKLDNESIDLVLCDPPYNTGMKKTNGKAWLCHFFDDDYTDSKYLELVNKSCQQFYRILKNDRACYVFMNYKKLGLWLEQLGGAGLNIKNVIVWNKIVHGLNYQNYAYTYELIIYSTKGNFTLNNKTKQDSQKGYFKDVWNIQRKINTKNDGEHHETQKHEAVLKIPLLHATNEGDLVLDCFMGSGTTGIACKEMKRDFIGIELRKDYFKTAQNRILQTQESMF